MDLRSLVEKKRPTLVGPQRCHLAETSWEAHQARNQSQSSSAALFPCYASWELAPVHADLSLD